MEVRFIPLGRMAAVRTDETILDVARRAGAPLGNSCGGIGICGRCRVRVVSDNHQTQLSPPTEVEKRIAAERGFEPDERLACQAVVLADCAVTTSYW